MSDFRQDFLKFALEQQVLKFGEFTTKAGRLSPYFFNAGLFNDGAGTLALAKFYAEAIIESKVAFDMLFGPAYKGIIDYLGRENADIVLIKELKAKEPDKKPKMKNPQGMHGVWHWAEKRG